MASTRMRSNRSTYFFWLLIAAATGCSHQKPTAEEFGRLADEFAAKHSVAGIANYKCSEGEHGWDYVCFVTWKGKSANSYVPPPQRVGVRLGDYYYQGKPIWTEANIPNEGPVLSRDEAKAFYDRKSAEAKRLP